MDIFDTHSARSAIPPDLHLLTITIGPDGLEYNLECRHEEFPKNYVCGKECVDDFWEIFSGEKTTPSNGLITFQWEGSGEDAELWWHYATAEEVQAAEWYDGDPELKPIWELNRLVRKSVRQVERGTTGATSVGFFYIEKKPDAVVDALELSARIKAATKGYHGDETIERLLAGPSYIELGGWIGDQGAALCLMGLGSILGLWDIITPMTLGIEGEQANQMMGRGWIMIAPGADSLLRS